MIIVIDGYNLLKHLFPGTQRDLTQPKKILFKQLAYYKAHKGAELDNIIIVFDAGPSTHATRTIQSGLVIIYSGTKTSADSWIVDFVNRNKGKAIVVVTHDRALADSCQALGACKLAAEDFYTLLQTYLLAQSYQLNQSTTINHEIEKYTPFQTESTKPHSQSDAQSLDLLMEQATQNMVSKEECVVKNPLLRKKKSFTLSKQEKLLQSIIKKLH